MMIQALLALVAASMFAGAAFYISWAEHPARLGLPDAPALAHWGPSYKRATPMQAGLALTSFALGAWSWLETGAPLLLAGAILILAVVPFTLIVVKPLNDRMLAVAPERAGSEERAMLIRWGRLHWVRNLLALAAVIAYTAWLTGR